MTLDMTEIAQTLGRIEGKLDALAAPDTGRVAMLEKSLERQWWFSVAIAPILALTHAIARKLGMNV